VASQQVELSLAERLASQQVQLLAEQLAAVQLATQSVQTAWPVMQRVLLSDVSMLLETSSTQRAKSSLAVCQAHL
jgi:hypothetical protein